MSVVSDTVLRPFLRFGGFRRVPLIRQTEAAECGLACLAMVAGWHGLDTDMTTLRRKFSLSMKGASMEDIVEVASALDLSTRALRCEPEEFNQLRLPCILHWEFKHFVVLTKVGRRHIVLHDPALGERRVALRDLDQSFTGIALEVSPSSTFKKRKDRVPLEIFDVIRLTPDVVKALLQGLLLSALLELFVLLSPFYMQLVVDEAILKGDHDLLLGLAVAFALLYLFNAAASAFRSFVFQYLGNTMSFAMEGRLFHHLVRLPLSYFQKRSVGDLLQRFHALEPVKQLVIGGGISTVLDGSLSVFTAIIMLRYDTTLSLIVFGIFAFYAILRIATRRIARRFSADAIVADAKEQTRFLETLRAIQTIKTGSGETIRESGWQNLYADKLNTAIRVNTVQIWFSTIATLISSGTDVLIVYLAASQAIDGKMSVGMITAFMAYKGQFLGRMTSLLDQLIAFWLLEVQLNRVADIALADREPHFLTQSNQDYQLQGSVELRDVSYRYAPRERDVIKKVSIDIRSGECVVIFGVSGGGKSTLLKLLTGLFDPTEGEVLFDGLPISALGLNVLRPQMGVVLQEDQLLAGTIADNIALFDEKIDMERVYGSARRCGVHDEVMRFPMQYNSLVGDMGSTLSSGQKQRVLLARALYRKPQLLILDEGTAHLDPDREAEIRVMLRNLQITRIIVAHNPAMAEIADRTFKMSDGKLLPHYISPSSISTDVTAKDLA